MMTLNARNALSGNIETIRKGAVTTPVNGDIGKAIPITWSITNGAADDLDLTREDSVMAIIKSSDLIIGT